jgi:hypothetical protein
MTINLDRLSSEPGRPGSRQAHVRQQQWLFELEQALLAGKPKRKAESREPGDDAGRNPDGAQLAGMVKPSASKLETAVPLQVGPPVLPVAVRQVSAAAQPHASLPEAQRQATTPEAPHAALTAAPAAQLGVSSSTDNVTLGMPHVPEPAGGAANINAAQGSQAGLRPGSAVEIVSARPGDMAQLRQDTTEQLRVAAAQPKQGASTATTSDASGGTPGLLLSGTALGVAPGTMAGAVAGTYDPASATQALSKVTQQSADGVLSVSMQPAAEREHDDSDASAAFPDETPAAPAAPDGAAEGEDYTSRLLHVYRDADGVQAWVRDASLKTWQGAALAQTMAGEQR